MKRFITLVMLSLMFTSPLQTQTWVSGQQLTISPKNIALLVDESATLKAFARTSASVPVAKPGVTWLSRDSSVVFVESKTNDEASLVARTEGRVWVVAAWQTRSGRFEDSVLVVVSPRELGSLPWLAGRQLLLMPKVNVQTVILKERDSVFLQGLARTSQGVPVADPLVQFTVDPNIATIRRVTNATAVMTVTEQPVNGVVPVIARWNTRSGVFVDTSFFNVEPTPEPTDVAIENVIITQAIQTGANTVPLVDNRLALVRVFLRSSVENTPAPQVRIRLLRDGVVFKTVFVSGTSTVPMVQTPAQINSTWNLRLDSTDVQGNLQVIVDLHNFIDADLNNNVWPRNADPFTVVVKNPLPIHIRFVPIFHSRSNRTAVVNESNVESYLRELRLMFPLSTITYNIRETFTSAADTLKSNDSNSAWLLTLSEISSLRTRESVPTTTYYVGIVNPSYGGGIAGLAYVPGRASLTWDKSGTRGRVNAHELGHNFSRRHVAACGSGNPDINYPHTGGRIGSHGWNYMTNTVIDSTITDIMGYCSTQWISDYTWNASMNYRGFRQLSTMEAVVMTEDIIEISGRITNDTILVNPVFRFTATPTIDDATGRFRVRLFDIDNELISDVPFEPLEIDHGNEIHFSFRSPLTSTVELSRLEIIRDDVVLTTVHAVPAPQDTVEILQKTDNIFSVNWRGNWESALVINVSTGNIVGTVNKSGDSILLNDKMFVVILSKGLTNQAHVITLK